MDRLNTSQLVWFLNESFTKKISGKSTNDIIKDIPLNISVEEFQTRMEEFFDQKGYSKDNLENLHTTRGVFVFLDPDNDESIFNFYYFFHYEEMNQSFVGVYCDYNCKKNEVCINLDVAINNGIRFSGHKVDLNSFDDLEEDLLIKDRENSFYSVKETELSLPLLIKTQQFLEKLVEKASKVQLDSLDVAISKALNDKEKIDVVKNFFF